MLHSDDTLDSCRDISERMKKIKTLYLETGQCY